MPAPFASMVDHSTIYRQPQIEALYDFETKEKIRDLTDDDKDLIFHKVAPFSVPGNYKKFIIEEPVLETQIGEYLFKLALNEMNWENFHDIKYKKVANEEFTKRIKQFPTYKFRYYYKNAWITYYFNQASRSRAVEEDTICTAIIHSAYPPHYIDMYLESPCMVKRAPRDKYCDQYTFWAQENTIYLDWTFGSCFTVIGKQLRSDDFFYTKPGEKDQMIECYTIDYDREINSELKPTEYYILDRDGYYFKSGKHNYEAIKEKVLKKHNETCKGRHSMEAMETWIDPAPPGLGESIGVPIPQKSGNEFKLMLKKDGYESFEILYANTVREIIARYNSFKTQWNKLMVLFNLSDDKVGWFCSSNTAGTLPTSPEKFSLKNTQFLNAHDNELMQKKFKVKMFEFKMKSWTDIKILNEFMDYGHCNIGSNKHNECIAINKDTVKSFNDYAIVIKHAFSIDAY